MSQAFLPAWGSYKKYCVCFARMHNKSTFTTNVKGSKKLQVQIFKGECDIMFNYFYMLVLFVQFTSSPYFQAFIPRIRE